MQRFGFSRKQAASKRTPRQINRSLIFHWIRCRQPISRADLARVSGLQRSTVSLIVEELLTEGWIVEGAMGRLPRGRRPTYLQLNDQRAVIAVDVHPSQTTIALSNLGGGILAQSWIDLPLESGRALQSIISAIKKLRASNKEVSLDGIGITLPGRFDLHHKKLVFAPNLQWPAMSVKSRIERATNLRVEVENVANACALSEVWFGESDGTRDLVVVNVSEGIGTGIFANGQLLRGENGMAGEFGHVEMDGNGPKCACGRTGCWETIASNRAGLRYFHESSAKQLTSFEALLKLVRNDDPTAIEAIERMASALGRGMRMIASSLAPAEIVVVGDITTLWHKVGGIIEAEVRRNISGKPPVLRPAYDGNTARLRSAVSLILSGEVA
jgi:predicted NBD/HSP70 family sugar kinase